ncbi:MAG: MFS transporter, partial [Candidatus Hodarchaeales archaeon]
MSNSKVSSFLDLYFRPSLLGIGIYQIVVTGTFTAQQFLLAAYLDKLGHILISGVILAVFFFFWATLAPICGTLSDLHGRKTLLISANWLSAFGFFSLLISPNPVFLFFTNAILGIGASLRLGSVTAFWIQHSPQKRVGESLAFFNIVLGIGGITGAILGFYIWIFIQELSFIVFGILLMITSLPIFLLPDEGDYIPFNISSTLTTLKDSFRNKTKQIAFFSKPMIQVSIHWISFSTIISFSTFIIPILDLIMEQIPTQTEIP